VTPAVSVCIPTYNYARFLGRAIDSVLAQDYRDFELIVVDNAS
jgi:glycosyltransferase involved in cell wall biosynthesis